MGGCCWFVYALLPPRVPNMRLAVGGFVAWAVVLRSENLVRGPPGPEEHCLRESVMRRGAEHERKEEGRDDGSRGLLRHLLLDNLVLRPLFSSLYTSHPIETILYTQHNLWDTFCEQHAKA